MTMFKILMAALLTGFMTIGAGAIEEGDTRDSVIDALGEPDGGVTMGDTEFLYYQRGQVEIKDGKVSNHTIVSQAEADALREKRKEEERNYFAAMEKKKAERQAAVAERSAATEVESEDKKLTPEEIRKKAEIEAKIKEGLKDPPVKTSSRKLRKYRRGRSQSSIDQREAQLRKEYETD